MKNISSKSYKEVWIAFVNINAEDGYSFSDLIDYEDKNKEKISGAVAYIALKAPEIHGALDILCRGLQEYHFKIESIYEIRNAHHLFECNELSDNDKEEIRWLLKSKYVFKFIDKLWPYK